MCTSEDSVATVSMTKPVRKGYLTRYKKRFLGSNWREEWVVLHEDSALEWYKEHNESELLGAITLKEAPEMIAAGPYACYVPGRPDLPKGTDPNSLMVFGNKAKDKTHWFITSNVDDLTQWMTAISNTLPPPPPEAPKPTTEGVDQRGDPPPYYAPSAPTAPTNPPTNAQSGGYARGYPGGGRGGGGYGGGGYGRGEYGGGGNGGTNTVIVDRRDNGVGDFASGMMMGAALSGWGYGGWGFGMGFGVPMRAGFGYYGGGFNNQETNITNNYNINNETVNNADGPGGVDPGVAQPEPGGLEPEAEMIPDGVDPGLLDEGEMDMAGMDMGQPFQMGGMDDMGGEFDMGGMDDLGGGFDMGGFDMGGFDMGF